MKLSIKERIVFGIIMGIGMTTTITTANLIRKYGFSYEILRHFWDAFSFSIMISLPTAFFLGPRVRKITNWLVKKEKEHER